MFHKFHILTLLCPETFLSEPQFALYLSLVLALESWVPADLFRVRGPMLMGAVEFQLAFLPGHLGSSEDAHS